VPLPENIVLSAPKSNLADYYDSVLFEGMNEIEMKNAISSIVRSSPNWERTEEVGGNGIINYKVLECLSMNFCF
jgi:hypothetical protein